MKVVSRRDHPTRFDRRDRPRDTVTLDFAGMSLEMDYKGGVAVGEIKLDMEVFGMPFSFVV
jgi:hypothetical protein